VTQIAPHSATVHLAIELSRSAWLVAARLPGVEKPSLHRIGGGDTAALLALDPMSPALDGVARL
jgi:hypothetical protein